VNYYETHLGTNFGFVKGTGEYPVKGIKGTPHSFREYGIYPASKPVISAPEVQSSFIDIPGRDGALDTTETLDEVVHYRNREATFEFVCVDKRDKWDVVYHNLLRDLHGRNRKIIIDEEPDGYYEGRLTVSEPEYDGKKGEAFFTIEGNLQPFKMQFNNSWEDWLWDPFCFETDYIEEYNNKDVSGTVRNPQTITLYGSDYTQVPDIVLNSGTVSVTYININGDEVTKALVSGSNLETTPDLVLRRSSLDLNFTGTGNITIKHSWGWL